jgi:hypothetical protein
MRMRHERGLKFDIEGDYRRFAWRRFPPETSVTFWRLTNIAPE